MKKFIPIIISIATFLVVIGIHMTGLFEFLELNSYDSRMNLTVPFKRTCDDVMLIMVDEDSIKKATEKYGWSFPWPREAYGKIFSFLDEGEAASCTYDILFTTPSSYGEEDDLKLAEAFASAKTTGTYTAQFWNGEKEEKAVITKPVSQLLDVLDFFPNTTSVKDKDDVIRRSRIQDNINGEDLTYMGFAPIIENVIQNGEFTANLPLLYDKKNETQTVKLNFKGDIDLYAHYSAMEILESIDAINEGTEPFLTPENFTGAHVFVIYYAPGLFDICSSPMGKVYPGAGIAITGLDNYLTDDFISTLSFPVNAIIILTFCFLGVLFSVISSKQKRTGKIIACNLGLFIAGIVILFALSFGLFILKWDSLFIAPFAGFVLSFIGNASADYFMEGRQKRFIKNAFSQYLSPAVIDQLVSNPDKLKLGGERRNISIFFSDVQSFTTLSESLEPEELTDLLNIYLSEMSRIILETGGTIDKYEGDAIIAFWNAPADIPDHSVKALEAAVRCQEKLSQMEEDFIKKVGRPMWTRIGINTGDAVVGNMGSENRFDYTMFGDSVNLASRLEGMNKQFGTYIMCSANTKNHAQNLGSDLVFRELGKVQVVGKTEAVQIFEPMTKEAALKNAKKLNSFSEGLKLFYEGDLTSALKIFEENKEDAPSSKYAEKCRTILENGTNSSKDENWKGIWIATSK